ncbi:MAG: plasmid pRiA4b ORF-3 family protein [Pseudonocardiaceae bacterium]
MTSTRRGKRNNDGRLAAVQGCGHSDDEVAELRAQLAAAGAPEEVLRALDSARDLREALRNLVEAGVLPSPEESLAGLLKGWQPLLEPGVDTFRAELSGAEFLGTMRQAAPEPDEVPEILAGLVGDAESTAKPEALAMLRVLAVLFPPELAPTASEAADRMVAAGLTDCPWVSGLGTPSVGPCFGFVDGFGAQEGITVSFSYGRKTHAFVVLIDHGLGGGVKDCYPTENTDKIRDEYQKITKRYGWDCADYSPAAARAILERALAARPCPVEPDQVEDVGDYLDLLRRRVALLPTAATLSDGVTLSDSVITPLVRPGAVGKRRAPTTTVHQVKISLRGAKPPIWRRLEVPSGITLHQLHHTIQEAFGWAGDHLWVFSTPIGDYGMADPELGHRGAASVKLAKVAGTVGERLRYTYDFGDDWQHEILIEEVRAAEPGVTYPRALAGRRAGPPEDCGGIWAYQELCEILADPSHPEHADRLDWLGLESAAQFTPAQFDLTEVNEALPRMA